MHRARIDAGESFAEAIKTPLAVILASPSFLYQSEPTDQSKRQLTDRELAVRLSYFLWSGPPDEELLATAERGELIDPTHLREQTDRMLADERSWEFVSGFAHQWLDMERLGFFQFNHRRFADFDESVKAAARQEIYHTLNTVLQEDMSIGQLLKSEFVVINDLLANYYGIDGVQGNQFRKVNVPMESPRGGLLATAAVLAMGSDGERSSPVERGSWVLRHMLHDPPPPAPANVPQLSRIEDKLLSARQLQTAHMEEPQCAQCHRNIDPIGFGLENFDAAGKWRDRERVEVEGRRKVAAAKNHPINPSGTLPDGTEFKNFHELRDAIATREDAFAKGLTESLIGYGLGRPYGFSDYELAERITAQASDKQNQLREFIQALVHSPEFQTK